MIIFINGSINSGKSTVSKLLQKEIPNTALLEIDSLHEMIEWMPIDQAVPLNWSNAISLIKNFVNEGMNVLIPYPISQKNYDYVISALDDFKNEISFFTLSPDLEKTLTNRGSRELTDWETERIKHHYEIGINNPSFGEIIDNTNLSPEDTRDLILSKII
jgi:hypothetical protein